jgi:hypothetical protein
MKTHLQIVRCLCILISGMAQSCMTWSTNAPPPQQNSQKYSYKIITDRKLEWSDFTGNPDYATTWAAFIYWKVFYTTDSIYTYGLPGDDGEAYVEPNIKVWYAISNRSWVKPIFKNDEALKHEQGHFDIAKLCALEFQNTVALMKPINRFNWKHGVDSALHSIFERYRQVEKIYDLETNHSLDVKAQADWEKKLAERITKMNRFSTAVK